MFVYKKDTFENKFYVYKSTHVWMCAYQYMYINAYCMF